MSGSPDEDQRGDTSQPQDTPSAASGEGARKAIDNRRVLACGTCRKRKLKCDSKRPKCSTCARLGHPCHYDEVRKKSGPKRGYVKELEARLKQVETLLQNESAAPTATAKDSTPDHHANLNKTPAAHPAGLPGMQSSIPPAQQDTNMGNTDFNFSSDFTLDGMAGLDDFNWDMISLGLEEPLPSQDIMDELYQVFFEKVHPSLPFIHRPRFMASLNMSINQRPPVCLRYIMWAHACALIPQYKPSAEQFYQKSRKYIEQDEMKGHGEGFVSIAHAQAWVLIGTYEFKTMYFPRAWMSAGRATRLAQLMGLHRQDRVGLDVKQTMAPPKDWIEREERRRTFWMCYCQDRYASIGTGWPMAIDERDILTNLPASDEAYLTGRAEPTPALQDVMDGQGTSGLSSFAGVCLLATLFGRNLTHLHRPAEDDNDHDLNGEFWKRHRSLDNILLNTSLSLPSHLRLPYGLSDPNIVFANMNIHTSTICLHQAAIFKADKHKLPAQISAESKRRCIVAADQITNIMKMCSHLDLALLNPFIAFCLYVAARVFVQYLKSKKDDTTVRASLVFLLSAMTALRHKNPLTESFLVQLDVDLEGSGLSIPSPLGPNRYHNRPAGECPPNTDAVRCAAIYEYRESQTLGQTARELENQKFDAPPDFDTTNFDFAGMGIQPMSSHASHQHPPGEIHKSARSPHANSSSMTSKAPTHGRHGREVVSSVDNMGPAATLLPDYANVGESYNQSPTHFSPNNTAHSQHSRPSPNSHSTSSHSNQPTPSSSHNLSSNTSNVHGGSNSDAFSPSIGKESVMTWGDSMQSRTGSLSQHSPPTSTNTYFSASTNPNVQPSNIANSTHNGLGSLFGAQQFSMNTSNGPNMPNPKNNVGHENIPHSGFTPGPNGESNMSTGLTPGPTGGTGMTPMSVSGWNEMSLNEGEWMYGDWGGSPRVGEQ